MAKFTAKEAEKYLSSGGSYFGLKNDKDSEIVRIMYNDEDQIFALSVHEVKNSAGYTKKIDCLRQAGDSKEVCPLCMENYKLDGKIYIPLYIESTGEVQIWERSRKYVAEMLTLLEEYEDLCNIPFKITRNGKAGSTKTTYTLTPLAKKMDEKTLEELGEPIDVYESGMVLVLTAEEMEDIAETGVYIEKDKDEQVKGRSDKKGRKVATKKKEVEDYEDEEEEEEVRPKKGKLDKKDKKKNKKKEVEEEEEEDDEFEDDYDYYEDDEELEEDDEEEEEEEVKPKKKGKGKEQPKKGKRY